jgi:hypothetical protein
MRGKQLYDLRGKQSSILRLWRFDKGALLHMLSNRILMIFALFGAVVLVWDLHSPSLIAGLWSRIVILAIWLLFTPQLFGTFKALSIVSSRGAAFGHLNESFVRVNMKKKSVTFAYRMLPYAAVAVWLLGFAGLVLVWFG